MKTQKALLIGCGAAAAIGLLVLVCGVVGIAYVMQDPEGLAFELRQPGTVEQGTEFQLEVQVINKRARKPLTIDTIDIAEDYLKGFTLVSYDPPYNSSFTAFGSRSFEFGSKISPRETNVFTFTLRARIQGHFVGDVDVCENVQFLTQVADTMVE